MNVPTASEELDRRFGIPGIAKVCEGNGGLHRIQITLPRCQGEIYLHGAQVTSWKPTGHDEVLFVSSKSHWQDGQAIRGGIPICFPWFRGKADDAKAPAHESLTGWWNLADPQRSLRVFATPQLSRTVIQVLRCDVRPRHGSISIVNNTRFIRSVASHGT